MEEKNSRTWLWKILDFINPLRDPSLTVAAVLTFIEEAGQHNPWYLIIVIALVNWLAVRGIVWLVVNFAFASVFLGRRIWWSVRNPRLAWRILDAVGHEDIIIGGGSALSDSIMLQDGTTIMSPMLGANGIHIIGELPAGTELPMLGMPNTGQMNFPDPNGAGFYPGGTDSFGSNSFAGQPMYQQTTGNNPFGNNFVSTQSTDGLPSQRPSQEEDALRQQVTAYEQLLEDWIQFTEEKWRAISDSQLGWKPLRGRWGNWDDIFSDVYAAKTSDPLAEAAQLAGEATARRFETSRERGSAASAVSCFMRDMMTLRRSLDMIQQQGGIPRIETAQAQSSMQSRTNKQRIGNTMNRSMFNETSSGGNTAPRSSLIRRPAQIFVDADTKK